MTNPKNGLEIDLSLVVPVWNAGKHLQNLTSEVEQLDQYGVSWQIIFVDDGSTDDSADIMSRLAENDARIVACSNPGNMGAGIARNLGWGHVVGRYTLFFDADDDLHTEAIPKALKRMDALPDVDTAMFAYRYEREETASFTAMAHEDTEILNGYLNGSSEAIGLLDQMPKLLNFTNYPWNKILRTEHFRNGGIRFGSTKVHNDILGHWHSLLFARNIVIFDDIICTHIVHPSGNNLTNRTGRERLQMFDAMSELYDLLEEHPDILRRYAHFFWALTQRLMVWNRPRTAVEYQKQLDYRYSDLISRIDLGDLARMRIKRAPELGKSLSHHLLT